MVLMALPIVFAALAVNPAVPDTGAPGTFVTVTGTSETVGGELVLYWDQIHAWDGTSGELGRIYATGTAYSFKVFIPAAKAGLHYLTVDDLSSDVAPVTTTFTVEGGIVIDPKVGLAGDVIEVTGKGFNPTEIISMEYYDGTSMVALTTAPIAPQTNALGTFTCTFVVPVDAVTLADNIAAEDVTGETGTATLTVGPYIVITPKKGLAAATVEIAGRGFTPNKLVDIRWYLTGTSYVTILDNAPISATGDFTVTVTVPLLPDPVAPGSPYTIRAIDNAPTPIAADATFTLIQNAAITLTPPAGKVSSTVTVAGTWFSASKLVSVTLAGTEVAVVMTAGDGSFSTTFTVPADATLGAHTVTATDSKAVTASKTFTVVVDVFMVATRATEYTRMDFMSITSQATAATDVYLVITDPNGLAYYRESVASGQWVKVGAFWYIPYDTIDLTWWPLTADAPLGTWNFTAYTSAAMTAILDTNLFTVAAKPTQQDVLDRLDEIEDVIITTEGDIIAVVNTKSGQIMTSLDALGAKLQGIEDVGVIIATDVGEIKVDIAALDLDALGVEITSIKGDVATIKSNIGTVTTSVSTLDATVTDLSGDVATVSTTLGTLQGTVTSIDGKVATIDTSVGTLQADISDVSGKVDTTPAWIAVVLSLVAAIAAIFAVITIRQKIAG